MLGGNNSFKWIEDNFIVKRCWYIVLHSRISTSLRFPKKLSKCDPPQTIKFKKKNEVY